MNSAETLIELEKAIFPYMFLWEEWAAYEYCTLFAPEVETINFYIKRNFSVNSAGTLMEEAEADKIYFLIRKLELGYRVFRHFAIVTFYNTIIDFANRCPESGNNFLMLQICDLVIPQNMKTCLQAFKVDTISLIFILYRPTDFQLDNVFKNIAAFLLENKKNSIINLKI